MPTLDSPPGRGSEVTPVADPQSGPNTPGLPAPHAPASLRGAARGGSINIVGALCNQAALLVTTAVIARFLGKTALGEYALGLAILAIVGIVGLFGFQMTLTRFVANHLADSDYGRLRGTIRLGVGFSVCLSTVLAIGLAIFAAPIAGLLHQPAFAGDLRLVALALPAGTIRDACLAAVQGWRTQRAFAVVTWIYEPLTRLGLTLLAVALGAGIHGAFIAIPIGAWTAALLAATVLLRHVRKTPHAKPVFRTRMVFSFSTISLGTGLASVGLIWADVLMLGAMSTTESVGIYNVSTRLVNLAVFVMLPINAAFAPQFAHLLHRQRLDSLNQIYTAATAWILRLSLPAFVLLIIFASELLQIFGSGYSVGAAVTVILSIGQLVNAGTGPCGTLLNMGGKVGLNTINNIAVLVLNVALNLWLIPRHGIIGAAVAWSFSLTLVNLARVIELRVILHAMPFGEGTVRSLGAAAAAAAAGLAIRLTVPTAMEQVILGVIAIVLVYLFCQLTFGLDREDKALVIGLIRRR